MKNSTKLFSLLFIVACMLLSLLVLGCASIIHGTKQTVRFQTTPTECTVDVTDALGTNYGYCTTPCSMELKRKREYKVSISKEGYETAELTIERKSDGWIWGNILFGGIIGIIVDFSNGAAYKLSPDELTASLNATGQSGMVTEKGDLTLVILEMKQLPDNLKMQVVARGALPLY